MSNPFEKNESALTSTEEVSKNQDDKNNNPILQSTLLKRVGGTPMDDRYKRFPGEVDKISNESGSHCGASPFEVAKQDHNKLNSANSYNQHLQPNNNINQSISLTSNQQKSVSLEKNNNLNNINNSNILKNERKSSIDDDNSFVTVPFSPPMKAFTLEKTTSKSELPYMNPDGNSNGNNNTLASFNTNLTTSTDPLLNPGIDRSYYNMNSRIGSNIPLDDPNNENISTRVTTAIRNSPQVNAETQNDNENGPMVNININPGTFAEPNGAEIPVVPRRRRNEDTIGVVVMICVILIIIGGCIVFLFI